MKKKRSAKRNIIQTAAAYTALTRVDLQTWLHQPTEQWLAQKPEWTVFCAWSRRPKKKRLSRRRAGANDESQFIAYQFEGFPDAEQAHQLSCFIGSCRFLWNRMLSDRLDFYKFMEKTLNNTPADYKDIDGLEWLKETDSLALANVQLKLDRTFSDWLSGKCGRPRYKKKHRARASYTTNSVGSNIQLDAEAGLLKMPKIKKPIRVVCHRKIAPGGVLKNITVCHEPSDRWTFSIVFEYPKPEYQIPGWLDRLLTDGSTDGIRHTGLDMSLPHLYIMPDGSHPSYVLHDVLSKGQMQDVTVSFEKHYRKLESRIGREQRRLSRMEKDSSNYTKQCIRIAKLYAKAKHQRHDFLHQMAVRLARSYNVISIEDLDMAAMKQALSFGKSVSDNGWGLFVRYLEEACAKTGALLIKISRWFPSSKRCSVCGYVKKDLTLGERTYICPKCGHVMDRDAQAAVNIDREGMRMITELYNGLPASL